MKKLKVIVFLCGIIGIIAFSCEKTNDSKNILWELPINGEKTAINNSIDNIEFKFCLLNELGEPATVFNEGENFSFYFSVTNNRDEKLYFYPGFAYSEENDFCKVYNSSNLSQGKPFIFLGYDKIGDGAYPFDKGETYVFEQHWIDYRDTTWRWKYGYYKSACQKTLTKGVYYTGFKYKFRFDRLYEESSLLIDTLSFKVNFEIQ